MKQKIVLIQLFTALITSCNFSENKIDTNNDGLGKNDSLSSKNETNNSSSEEINKQSKVKEENDTIAVTEIQQTIPSSEILLTSANFDEKVLKSDQPVLVFFTAKWSNPCRTIAPFIAEIAIEYQGKAVIGNLDADSNSDICLKYGVRNFPTILIFKNGKVVDKQVGAVPKSVLVKKLNMQLSP